MKRSSRRGGRAAAAALLCAVGIAAPGARAAAEDVVVQGPYEPVRQDPVGSRLLNVPTPFTLGTRTLEVLFTHRFQEAVSEGDEHNLWGLDSGADVGIGLAYGVSRNFDLALYRSSFQEDFELAGKLTLLRQAPRLPLSLGLRAGADLIGRRGVKDRGRPFAQLLLGRRLARGWNVFLAPSWVRGTPGLRNATNVALGLTVPLPRGAFLELELLPRNPNLRGSVAAWGAAYAKAVGRHVFSLTLGNSRATTVDQYLGGDFAGGFKSGDVRLGFNLVRTFGL